MKPKTVNLHCYRGQTFRQNMYFKTKDSLSTVDLHGITCKSQIRPKINSKQLTAEFNCTVDADNGIVTLLLPASVTAEINPGTYQYDMKGTDENDEVKYYIAGSFTVTGRITE